MDHPAESCHKWSACQASARTHMWVAILFFVQVEELFTDFLCTLELDESARTKKERESVWERESLWE